MIARPHRSGAASAGGSTRHRGEPHPGPRAEGEAHPAAVVLLGPPGAGKGTVARRLAAEEGLIHLEMGRVLRERAERGDPVGDRIAIAQARGVMAPKELVLAALDSVLGGLASDARLVLDGFPRTTAQVAAVDDGRVPVRIDAAVWIDVDPEVAGERLRVRREREGRADDLATVVRTRLDLVDETVLAVRRLYERRGILEVVDGVADADTVYHRVRDRVVPVLGRAAPASLRTG